MKAQCIAIFALMGLWGARADVDPQEAALATRLNADFVADPLAPDSPLGVLVRWGDDFNFYCNTNCSDSLNRSDAHNAYLTWADCRTDATLLNHAWAISTGLCPTFPKGTIMSPPRAGGWVYNRSVLNTAVRCSYASDTGSRFRVNHGCGCDYMDQVHLQGHKRDNACKNIDPLTQQQNTNESRLVSACHCTNADQQPRASGEYDCYWEGPAFYKGYGANQIRQMVQQRMKYPERQRWVCEPGHTQGAWTEVVLDPHVLESQLTQDFARTVPAFVVSGGSVTREQVCEWQRPILKKYKLDECLPVLGFDVNRTSGPFFALPRAGTHFGSSILYP